MTPISVRTMGLRTHSRPRYVTPSRPSLKGSRPPIEIVFEGARRLPERRRRRVVLPAPLAPIRRVRDLGGRERVRLLRPVWVVGKV